MGLRLRTESQPQSFLRREAHSVPLERVSLHPGDELRLVFGADLETAVATQYLLHESPRRRC